MTDQLRVALLARAGAARDQLRKALEEAGAVIVAEGDPGELDPKDVKEKLPKVYLVGLEPATEKSIDRFDGVFGEDGVEVMTHEIQLVLAEDLYEERLPGDEPEELEVVPWKLDALHELVLREDFSEGRSIAGLFIVREVLAGRA